MIGLKHSELTDSALYAKENRIMLEGYSVQQVGTVTVKECKLWCNKNSNYRMYCLSTCILLLLGRG